MIIPRCFCPGSVSKTRAEAGALGLFAVINEPKLYRITAKGELHDFPQKMVAARMKVAEHRLF